MSMLTQSLIQTLNNEHAAKLAAVEESLGYIEEAEALAATLRHHGITEAKAIGFVLGNGSPGNKAEVRVYVSASITATDALTQALAAADLRISHISMGETDPYGYLVLHGLNTRLMAMRSACLGAAQQRNAELAHG